MIRNLPGNESARRAAVIACAGRHSVLLVGLPELISPLYNWMYKNGSGPIEKYMPCGCGFMGDPGLECLCTPTMIRESSTALRLRTLENDLVIGVVRPSEVDVLWALRHPHADDDDVYDTDAIARAGRLGPRRPLDPSGTAVTMLREAMSQLPLLTAKAMRVVNVAATIAKLADSEVIGSAHMAEAIAFARYDVYDYGREVKA